MIRKNLSNHVLRVFSICVIALLTIGGTLTAIAAPAGTMTATAMVMGGTQTKAINAITITASGAEINSTNDIFIRIPVASFPNTIWDTSDTTAVISVGGPGGTKAVSTTVDWPIDTRTLRLNATGNFTSGDWVTVSGLSIVSTGQGTVAATDLQWSVDGSVTYSATSGATLEIDTTAPTVLNTYSVDTDNDGDVDALDVQFSEPILDSSINLSEIEFDNDTTNDGTGEEVATGGSTNVTYPAPASVANDDYYRFTVPNGISGTELANLHITGTSLTDISGNAIVAANNVGTDFDRAAPVALGGAYVDTNGDGTIDGAGINFSENVTYAYTDTDWTATPNNLTSFDVNNCSACTNVNPLQLTATAAADITGVNAGTEPALSFAAGSIVDQSAAANAASPFGPISLTDMVSPVLIDQGYYDGTSDGQVDTVELEFSEYITLTSYADVDWAIGAGTIGLANETGSSVQGGNGTSQYLDLFTLGSANITGGVTAPTVTYTDNTNLDDGKGNDVAGFGPTNVNDWAEPFLLSFTSSTADATYGPGSAINITANYTESMGSGTITVVLDTGVSKTLNMALGTTISTNYTVGLTGSGENTTDLTVLSITSQNAKDASINANTNITTTMPATNIAAGSDIVVDTIAPTVTDGNISIAGATGTAGTYKIGDTVVVTWASVTDGNLDTGGATVDFTSWGGGAAVAMEDDGAGGACNDGAGGDDVWCAAYTILGTEGIDGTNINVTVTAADLANPANSSGAVTDTSNATVDTIMPTVTPGNLTVTGGTGTGGAFIVGDTPVLNWNFTADGETDTIASVTFDGSDFAAADSSLAGVLGALWTANLSAGMDSQDDVGNTIDATIVDNAGNSIGPITSSLAYTIDTQAPTFAGNGTLVITVDAGTVGVAAVNDGIVPDQLTQNGATVTTPDGDVITIDLTALTVDAVPILQGVQSGVVKPGALENIAQTFTITATDNAGNTGTTASSAIAVDNILPIFATSGLAISTDNGIGGVAAVNGGAVLPDAVNVNATVVAPDGETITWNSGSIGGGATTANNTPVTITAGILDSAGILFNVTATDDAGNVIIADTNTIDGQSVSVDNVIPIFATSGLAISTDNGVGGVAAVNGGATLPDQVNINATVVAGDVDTFTWDATPIGGGAAIANNTPDTVLAGATDNLTQTFNITVTDNGGNIVTSDSGTIDATTIPVDNTLPVIGTPGSFTITLDNNTNSEANVSDTVTYADGIPGIADGDAWTVDITGLTGTAAATNVGSPYTVIIGALNGATSFTETVTDNAGNEVTGPTATLAVDNRSPLDNTSVTLSNYQTSSATSFTVAFDTTSVWPADGKFELIFPAEFNVAGLDTNTATALTNVDGVITAAVTGQTVVLTRDNSGTPVAGGTSVSFNIATGTNGGAAGVTGEFSFKTLTVADALIDIDDNVAGVTLTAPPVVSSGGGGSAGGRVSPTPTPTEPTTEAPLVFSDVLGHWAEDYIYEAKDAGYVEGYEDETFKPDQYITRSEAAKLIASWLDTSIGDDACNADLFSDVDCSVWYAKYVTYLSNTGIIEGYGDGTFGPGNYINRAEALKMMLFAKALQDSDFADIVNPFSDVNMEQWFYNNVMIGYKLSIIQGYEDGTFGPGNNITRAEFTKIFIETLINN